MEVNGLPIVKLGEVLPRPYKNGLYKSSESYGSGTPILRITDFDNNGNLTTADLRKLELSPKEMKSYQLQHGDIVVNRVNSLTHLGKSILWQDGGDSIELVYESNMMRIEPDESAVLPEFLIRILQSHNSRSHFRKVAKRAVAQCSINQQDVKSLRFPLPPVSEQKKIAQILSTWDQAITATGRLLENSQQRKKGLMQQLLTGKRRLPGFEGEWRKIELGDVLKYQQPTPFLVKSTKYSNEFPTPVLTAGKTFLLGYTDENFGIYSKDLPAVIFDDFTTASQFVDFPFKAKSSAMKILTPKSGYSIRYIFGVMQMLRFSVGGHQRHWISIFANLVIPCPSFEEQNAISEILCTADKEIAALHSHLDMLKREKRALMQQLLTGKRRVKVETEAA